MMELIRIPAIPAGAEKEGKPMRLGAAGSIAQDWRRNGQLYEEVTRADGSKRYYRVDSGNECEDEE